MHNYHPRINIPINATIKDVYLYYSSKIPKDIPIFYYDRINDNKYFYITEEYHENSIGKLEYFGIRKLVPFFLIATMENRDLKKHVSSHFKWIEDYKDLSLFTVKDKKALLINVDGPSMSIDNILKVVDNIELSL